MDPIHWWQVGCGVLFVTCMILFLLLTVSRESNLDAITGVAKPSTSPVPNRQMVSADAAALIDKLKAQANDDERELAFKDETIAELEATNRTLRALVADKEQFVRDVVRLVERHRGTQPVPTPLADAETVELAGCEERAG